MGEVTASVLGKMWYSSAHEIQLSPFAKDILAKKPWLGYCTVRKRAKEFFLNWNMLFVMPVLPTGERTFMYQLVSESPSSKVIELLTWAG